MELSSYERNHLDNLIRAAEKEKARCHTDMMVIYNKNCGLQGGYPLHETANFTIVYRTDTQEINQEFMPKPLKPPEPVNCHAFFESRFTRCL